MNYKGEFYYTAQNDDDHIVVNSFIFRKNPDSGHEEISFDLVTTWASDGKWQRTGIATYQNGVFKSDFKPSRHVPTGEESTPMRCGIRDQRKR